MLSQRAVKNRRRFFYRLDIYRVLSPTIQVDNNIMKHLPETCKKRISKQLTLVSLRGVRQITKDLSLFCPHFFHVRTIGNLMIGG